MPAIPAHSEVTRRIFVPPSTMASGIRSATPPILREVPRAPVRDAIPEASRTQAYPPATLEVPMALGTRLARPEALRQELRPVSPAELHGRRRASVCVAMVGEAVGLATVGVVVGAGAAVGAGAGEVGASASDGRTGAATGRSAGILGGTTLIGMPRGRTPTTRITTTARTIRMRPINHRGVA